MSNLRIDAAARREQILDAAEVVYSEHGMTVPLELVVQQARIGRATLYRNFPDRADLIQALLGRSLQALQDEANGLADRNDALFVLLERMANNIAQSAPLVDYWRAVEPSNELIGLARQRMAQIFKHPLQRAIQAGLCRADLQLLDLPLIAGMLGAALRGTSPAERRVLAERALDLLRTGLSRPSLKD